MGLEDPTSKQFYRGLVNLWYALPPHARLSHCAVTAKAVTQKRNLGLLCGSLVLREESAQARLKQPTSLQD